MGQAELSTINEPEFVNFLGPQASILCEEIEDFRIVRHLLCVGEGHPCWSTHFQHAIPGSYQFLESILP